MDTTCNRIALILIALIWFAAASTYPAFPIDETRYLTVAWEMRQTGHWILPTLNGAPYSHKPPLLFWLINLVWSVTGPAVWAARIVSLGTMITVFLLTGKLAKTLYPNRPYIARIAPLLTLASPLFLIFGMMIMFDFLLYAAALAAMIFLWRASHDKAWKNWIFFGLAMGVGVLAKGPVILVHTMGAALLAPFLWLPEGQYSKPAWYGRVVVGILIATAVGLAWAIPAAVIGGHQFAHMIFWGQSADRMVNSFAHRRGPFFYLPLVFISMLPWLFAPPVWKGLPALRTETRGIPARFILCWIVPAFIVFSLISGKQAHYIVPLTSGLAILIAAGIERANPGIDAKPSRPWFFALYTLILIALIAAPSLGFIGHNRKNQVLAIGVSHFERAPFIAALILAATAVWLCRKRFETQLLAMIVCAGLAFSALTLEGARYVYGFYDLSPLEPILAPYGGHPVAYIGKYAGEIGFTARLTGHVEEVDLANLAEWFRTHPDGIAVTRDDNYKTMPGAAIAYSQLYRGNERIFVLLPPKIR